MSGTSSGVTVSTAEERRLDKNRMKTVLMNLAQVPKAALPTHPIYLALKQNGIIMFNDNFTLLTTDHIEALQYIPVGGIEPRPLELMHKLVLRAILAFYHSESHKVGGGINMATRSLLQFKEFQTLAYDPNKPIIPWALMTTHNDLLSNWNKSIKPNARDFKPFREANNWLEHKLSFQITLDSQNLSHLIDEGYVPTDIDVDKAQQKFLYKVMLDNFVHHEAKAIVKKHIDDKDTRQIWKEIMAFYDDSITTSINADMVLNYLTSVRLKTANWNKSHGEFVAHFANQIIKYNQMAPDDALSNSQKVRMLQNVVSGVPHLANVLNTYRQARRAAGRTIEIDFDTYVSMLSDQAQVYDNANTTSRNSYRRTANVHDVEGDEGYTFDANVHDYAEEEQEPSYEEILDLEANVTAQRDRKTGKFVPKKPFGNKNAQRQANQMEQPQTRRRAYMDQETWNSISEEDRKTWDQLSDSTRTKITSYHFNKGKEYALRGAEANKVEASEHDIIFDDELENDSSDIEARVHETDHHNASYSNDTRLMYEEEGVDFDKILQAQQVNTRLHAGMHQLGLNDSGSDSDDEEDSGIEVHMHAQGYNPRAGVVDFSDTDEENSSDEREGEETEEPNEQESEFVAEEKEPSIKEEEKEYAIAETGEVLFTDSEEESEDEKVRTSTKSATTPAMVAKKERTSPQSDLTHEGTIDPSTQARLELESQGVVEFSDSEDEDQTEEKTKTADTPQGIMTRKQYKEAGVAPPEIVASPEPKKKRVIDRTKSKGLVRSMSTGNITVGMLVDSATKQGKPGFESLADIYTRDDDGKISPLSHQANPSAPNPAQKTKTEKVQSAVQSQTPAALKNTPEVIRCRG